MVREENTKEIEKRLIKWNELSLDFSKSIQKIILKYSNKQDCMILYKLMEKTSKVNLDHMFKEDRHLYELGENVFNEIMEGSTPKAISIKKLRENLEK